MAKANFNSSASSYDSEFVFTHTGRGQRARVQHFAFPVMRQPSLHILELNCGTGEDAQWMGKMGHFVLATDVSPEMVKTTAFKSSAIAGTNRVKSMVCGFEEVGEKLEGLTFDCVFSNFGGLNCLDPKGLKQLSKDLGAMLPTGGRFIAVIMPRGTLWERMYFLLKGKWGRAFRRNSKEPLEVELREGETQQTWYYTPREFSQAMENEFMLVKKYPVGICIPPSYMEPMAIKRPGFFKMLVKWERFWSRPWLSNWGDHCYLEFARK